MAASVSLPEANLVPLQPPLAAQLDATGVVDQVSTGVTLPVPEAGLAVKVMVPAVCARANVPNNINDSAQDIFESLCIPQLLSHAEAEGFWRWPKSWDAVQPRGADPQICGRARLSQIEEFAGESHRGAHARAKVLCSGRAFPLARLLAHGDEMKPRRGAPVKTPARHDIFRR
jgi:hypothetical protein